MVTALLSLVLFSQADPAPLPLENVVFHEAGGQELQMDIWVPEAEGPHPAVVVLHGGAWVAGKRQDMNELAEALADEGFVAATASYRLAPANKWPSMLEDSQAAVRYLRENAELYGIDDEAVGALGASAGGHLALLLGSRENVQDGVSSKVGAVVNIFGPTDLSVDYDVNLKRFMATAVAGVPLEQAGDIITDMSPLNFIDGNMAPVFTIHGSEDQVVPVKQAQRLTEALRDAEVPYRTLIIENMGHEIDPEREDVVKALEDSIAFLRKHLAEGELSELDSAS
jgi:acetyl esterase/lipase